MTARIIPGVVAVVVSAGAAKVPTRAVPVVVAELRTEYATNPVGIDVARPRLSWQLRSSDRGVVQTAYEIQVGTDSVAVARGKALVWDSRRVSSDASVQVDYGGPSLRSATRYWWRVRVWDGANRETVWSAPAFWESGFFSPSEWSARWIEPGLQEVDSISNPAPLLRRAFAVRRPIRGARLYITSHGLYQASINGKPVSDAVFTPGWTSYNKRLQYQTYDVTPLLRSGDNAIGVMLGDGWYRGRIGFSRQRNVYGHRLGLLAQLRVLYTDGREETITTDSAWRASTGAVRSSDIYDGETYDARLEHGGWNTPGFNDGEWQSVRVGDAPTNVLVAPVSPPVRRIQEIVPVTVLHTPAGQTVFDMGQNMVGWVRLRVRGPAGTTVTLHHAEVLDKEGNVYVQNLRAAAQTDRYTLKGGGEEVFEPHFTFHGFRYVWVDGYPGEPTKESVAGIVLHSDMARTGEFDTSNPLLNQLQHNIQWGQYGNFVDVPTDCPQRDERLGWTGDAQVFSRTAAFNMDVAGFFTKWLRDMAADQHAAGSVPHVLPNVLGGDSLHNAGSAGWADAVTVIPWNMYVAYGDKRLLAEQYPSMRAWVEFERRRAGSTFIWNRDSHYGDWLAYATTRADYPGATTGKDLIATAYFAHSTDLLARSAAVIGRDDDARAYRDLFDKIRGAFQREFVTSTGRVGESTQTAYVLALAFDLLPDSLRANAASRLAADVRSHGNHLTTGFLGTPELNHVLSRTGHTDVAYSLLLQETYPSWLYPVKHGATTIWERWDGLKPDGSFQDPGMNSFNHYAYGAIGDWMYRVVAGLDLDPAHPGYKHFVVAPQPGGGLTHAAARVITQYGPAASSWDLRDGHLVVHAVVPPNTSASVRLPGAVLTAVREGNAAVGEAAGVRAPKQDGDAVVLDVGSGTYEFSYPYSAPVLETGAERPMPPEWIDRTTHHRVVRLSRSGGSNESFYFHNAPFFRDTSGNGDEMVFYGTTSNGRQIFSVNLHTLVVAQVTDRNGGVKGEIIAPKHREVIWQRGDSVFATHVDRHSTRPIATLPAGLNASVSTLNADETLLAGAIAGPEVREILAKYPSKSGYFDRIYEAHAPYALFTVDLRTGEFRKIHQENTWLNHVQFSPTDPNLLLYCHEGPWHLVDRIWTIDVRGGSPRQIHTRTVDREIAGHEFFSSDGRTIWYDLQVPRSVTFFLAGADVATGKQTRYALSRDEWSIHFTSSPDGTVFAGDGGDSTQVARANDGQWIYLFRPRGDSLEAERLVNMRNHGYRALEPNVHFTPDGRWVVFRANFEGQSQVYAVEIASEPYK
jgi:alpha-L-rhamnosidase